MASWFLQRVTANAQIKTKVKETVNRAVEQRRERRRDEQKVKVRDEEEEGGEEEEEENDSGREYIHSDFTEMTT